MAMAIGIPKGRTRRRGSDRFHPQIQESQRTSRRKARPFSLRSRASRGPRHGWPLSLMGSTASRLSSVADRRSPYDASTVSVRLAAGLERSSLRRFYTVCRVLCLNVCLVIPGLRYGYAHGYFRSSASAGN
ncbi:hypothetical protein BT93_J0299 [Corymbia citriodora subsp. variegata]|nr:hypothetical protein BT93_J0299 [Corymbia citriodora subsp. variegata]